MRPIVAASAAFAHRYAHVGLNLQFADSEVATKVVAVKSIPAAQLVPLLRPMLR